jgi:putative ABC transport system permease protein
VSLLDTVARDVRYAIRGFRRRPGFAAISLLTIAVGTGALASVLSVVHAVVLRSPAYPNADRIVQIGHVIAGRNRSEVSTVDVLALREAASSLSHVTIAWFSNASLAGGGLPERARRVYTDSQAFQMLGVKPLLGRLPTAADDAPDAEAVAVIGERLWLELFGSDPGVIGRPLRVDGRPYVVIGVMPATFSFPAPYWAPGDLWLLRGPSHPSWPNSRDRFVLAFGLLKEGVTVERAQSEADAVAASLDERYPAKGRIGLELTSWAETIRTAARPRLWLLLGAAAIVFVIVCVNVANLLVSRGLERQRELAARVALGAGTARLLTQLLTETGLLFVLGGAGGVLAAIWGSRLLVAVQSSAIPGMADASVDLTVATAAMTIALVAAAIVGLVPAFQAAVARTSDVAASGVRGATPSRGWRRIQRSLVAAEIGLALILLCGAAVLLEGARTLARVDPGFAVDGLVHARLALPPDKYAAPETQAAFYDRVIEALLKIPGVTGAGAVSLPPGLGGSGRGAVLLDGDPVPTDTGGLRRADLRVVSAGYLEALGLAPRSGRFFSAADSPGMPVAVVNETFVRRYGDAQSALGRSIRITLDDVDGLDGLPRAIVGVVPDLKEKTLYEPAPPTVYIPIAQAGSWPIALRMALLVRSTRATGDLTAGIRAAIADVDPDQAAFGIMPMGDVLQNELSLNRLNLALLGVLSTLAVFLATIGVYGATAQAVRQRTREIGIRLALGVSKTGVLTLVLRDGGVSFIIGCAVGAAAVGWSTGLLRSLVPGIDRSNPLTFVSAGLVLASAVLAACYFPARQASRIDPAVVLRAD